MDMNKCEEFIKNKYLQRRIVLIVSADFGDSICQKLKSDKVEFLDIVVYSNNVDKNAGLKESFFNIIGVFSDFKDVILTIDQKI